MDLAETYSGHTLFTHTGPPVVVESNTEMAAVHIAVAVAMSDEVAEIVAAIEGVVEYTPGDGDIIRAVLDIDIAVATVRKRAVVDPNVLDAVNADAVPIAYLVLVIHVQVLEDVVAFFGSVALEIAADMRSRQADDRLVAPDADVRTAQIDVAAYLNDVRGLLSVLHVVNKVFGVGDGNSLAALSSCRAAIHTCPAISTIGLCSKHV